MQEGSISLKKKKKVTQGHYFLEEEEKKKGSGVLRTILRITTYKWATSKRIWVFHEIMHQLITTTQNLIVQ